MRTATSGPDIAIPTYAAIERHALDSAAADIQSMRTAAKDMALIFRTLIVNGLQTGKIGVIGGEISFSEIPSETPMEVTGCVREKTGFANQLITEAFLLAINSELASAGWRATLHNGPSDICQVVVRPRDWHEDLSRRGDFIAG